MKNMLPAAVQHCKSGLYLSVILNRAAAADWTEQKHHRWQKLDCGSPRPTSNTQQRPVKNNSSSELMQISPINLCELTLSPSLPLFLYPWVYTVLHSLSISLMNVWWCCQLLTKSEGGTCSCSQTQGWHCVFLSFLFFFFALGGLLEKQHQHACVCMMVKKKKHFGDKAGQRQACNDRAIFDV